MKIRSVLFDLDGTLVDSLGDLTDAVNHVRQAFAEPPLTTDAVCTMIGKGAVNLLQQALPGHNSSDIEHALQLFLVYNAAHIADKSRLYPGVIVMLETLQAKEIRLAVVSNKSEALSVLILNALGIRDYFESISGGDTFLECKPSPLPLLRVIEQLGVTVRECIMVGDSINDIQAGNMAEIATVGCNWGYGSSEELSHSTFIADSFDDIINVITNLEKTV